MSEVHTIKWKEEDLVLSIDYPKNHTSRKAYKTVIICHGLIGSRVGVDRLFVKASKALTERGYLVVRFDYKGCGESSGEYGKNTFEDLISQTKTVIDYTAENVPMEELILLGHSLGGAVAVFTATEDQRVNRLIQWAAVGCPDTDIKGIFGESRMAALEKNEQVDFYGYSFYHCYFQSLSDYRPLSKCSSFNGDVFIAHGTKDDDISVHYLQKYKENYLTRKKGNVSTLLIENGEHTFSDSNHFNQLINGTIQWLENGAK